MTNSLLIKCVGFTEKMCVIHIIDL